MTSIDNPLAVNEGKVRGIVNDKWAASRVAVAVDRQMSFLFAHLTVAFQ